MRPASARGISAYQQSAVETASPTELVVMLYDGALKFIGLARAAIERRDIPARSEAISRALAIVGHLRTTLDVERGGDVAQSLDQLYDYVTSRLLDASFTQQTGPLDEAVTVLSNLRDGWASIGTTPAARP
jgi:flagellar protein FliS